MGKRNSDGRWFSHSDKMRMRKQNSEGWSKKQIAAQLGLSYDAFLKRCLCDGFSMQNLRERIWRQKHLTDDQLAEAIRLRVEENLYTTAIARRLKIRINTFSEIIMRDNIILPQQKFKKAKSNTAL